MGGVRGPGGGASGVQGGRQGSYFKTLLLTFNLNTPSKYVYVENFQMGLTIPFRGIIQDTTTAGFMKKVLSGIDR